MRVNKTLSEVMNDAELVSPDLFCVSVEDFNWLIQQAEELNKEKEINSYLLQKFGRLTALYIKAVEGDKDFTDFYHHMAEIVYPNGRINELK
jgi:hypothetical protein